MRRKSIFGFILMLASIAMLPQTASAQELTERTSGILFEAATNTQLAEALTQRRKTLEERQGEPLQRHQWWLWGLGSFDYDRDGDLDLIVCIHGSTNGMILRNELKETGKLTFRDATEQLGLDGVVPSTDNYPLVWDFNGDGFLDIAGLFDDKKTPCLLNQGGKRFEEAAFSLHPINYPDSIRDLNGDGYIDIAQTRRDKRIEFHYNAQSSSFSKSEAPAEPPVALPASLQAEIDKVREKKANRFLKLAYFQPDLNGDGKRDLVIRAFGSYSGERLGWYLMSDDEGRLSEQAEASGLPRRGAPLLMEDLDHDGDVYVLFSSTAVACLFCISREVDPLTEFGKQSCPYLHVNMRDDFDHDGDLGLAVSNRRYGREIVFENLGDGRFAPVLSVRGWDADPMVLRDINNDGLIDVIVGSANGKESIGVYLNATAKTGNYCQLYLRMDAPNVYAAGARVEVFPAGELDRSDPRPLLTEHAHLDGSPLHVGLGDATAFDLRVTFPGLEAMELKNVAARPRLFITPQGASTSEPK